MADLTVAAVSYQPCPPGQLEAGRACAFCRTGTFSIVPASLSCVVCPIGFVGNITGLTTCTACVAGLYWQPGPDAYSPACVACAVGLFSAGPAQVQCSSCASQSFNPSLGMTTCSACPVSSVSVTGQVQCSCHVGFYGLLVNGTTAACAPCPFGALCTPSPDATRTLFSVQSIPGYWRLAPTTEFYHCPLGADACLSSNNGSCAVGYVGVLCGICQIGYHNSGTSCDFCTGGASYTLPIVRMHNRLL